MTDPAGVVDRLVASREPYLVGVRHHSPALAAVLPALLEEADPQVLAVELPSQARGWLGWLTHPRARAPLALAFSHEGDMAFYPMADFSPELVALRWARDHGVEVDCIDLPVGAAHPEDPGGLKEGEDEEGARPGEPGGALWQALARRARARTEDAEEIWDRLVEAHAPGSTPGQVRAAALAHGWAARCRAGRPDALTLAREESMRRRTAHHLAAGRRVAALVGAFHAPALLDVVGHQEAEGTEDPDGVVGCVVAYGFAQLDSRSGYPAGIRDPAWQQLVVDSGLDPERIRQDTTQVVTLVTRGLRDAGHPAGPGEATATARLALDLATLRGLGAPSRRELIEATTSVLAQGEVLGRGRAVASVLEDVLVGDRRGSLAPGTPRAPLRDAVVAELERLGLPVDRPRTLTLAPARGGRELERHVLLHRLLTGGIGYGTCEDPRSWRGAPRVTLTWHLAWSAATEAGIELAAPRGLTPEQVATSTLMTRPLPDTPALHRLLTDAAQCASTPALERALDHLAPQVAQVGFTDAVALGGALADVALARVPGAGLLPQDVRRRAGLLRQELTGAALRELAGLSGSDRLEDAAALAAFATEAADHELGLSHALAHLTTHGSPLMQGAASGLLLDAPGQDDLSRRLVSWLSAPTAQARHDLRRRLAGLLVTAGGRLETATATRALVEEVSTMADAEFVGLLPALRGGFDVLAPEDRERLLADLAHQLGPAPALVLSLKDTVAAARYDTRARRRLAQLGLADLAFSPAQRWRMVLGTQQHRLPSRGRRMASALDELYGRRPEGLDPEGLDPGRRSVGRGPSQLGARQWREEIEVLFGHDAVEEILTQAAQAGRADVLESLDPAEVRPSVELLATALSLVGSLPEARLARLRPLVARLVRELTQALAVRLRPALTGLSGARPTRRHVGRLDLPRTLRANLRHVVPLDGRAQVVPVHPVFRQPVAKEADWHLIVVVDVSGSMSRSVVFSALTAAVLTGVPCLEVSFLAFSTEVIDFSGYVDDPLALLLEVRVGGGTDIAGAMGVARSRVRVPGRTLCVLVSDFEEGGPVAPLLEQVGAMHAAGVHLAGCAALDDAGVAAYNVGTARQLAAAGMRVAVLSPLELARWVGEVVRG